MATDPVCGMTVDEKQAAAKTNHQGETYYFCSAHCHGAFTAAPEKYLKASATAEPRPQHGGKHHPS